MSTPHLFSYLTTETPTINIISIDKIYKITSDMISMMIMQVQ